MTENWPDTQAEAVPELASAFMDAAGRIGILASLAKASVLSRGRCFESDADVALRRWLEKEGYIGSEPLPPTRGPASATLVES